MEEFKEIIRETPTEMLNTFLAIYKDLLRQVRRGSPAYNTFSQMIECIENEMRVRGINGNGSHVSETMKKAAINYLSSHGVNVGKNSNSYRHKEGISIIEGAIGIGGLIALVVIYAIFKELFEGAVILWNNGVLKIVLGLAMVGTGTYVAYKTGLFKKIKELFTENKKGKNSVTEASYKKNNEKENTKSKNVVKNLVIFSSTAVVVTTGMAHLNKYTKVLDGTILETSGLGLRYIYESVSKFAKERAYEVTHDYSEFENIGYMNYVNLNDSIDWSNFDTNNGDQYFFVDRDDTWEGISESLYGTPAFANHLRLYNACYDISDDSVKERDLIFVPNPDKLEDYISEKRLIKKR